MICALDSPGSSAGRGHVVVFLGKTLYCLIQCLSPPRCKSGYREFNARDNPAME